MAPKVNKRKKTTKKTAPAKKPVTKRKKPVQKSKTMSRLKLGSHEIWREISGVMSLAVAVFFAGSALSLVAGTDSIMGPFGHAVASFFYGLLGLGLLSLSMVMAYAAIGMITKRQPLISNDKLFAIVLSSLSVMVLAHLSIGFWRIDGVSPGGALGEGLGEVFRSTVSTAGTTLLALLGLVVALIVATPLRMSQVVSGVGSVVKSCGRFIKRSAAKFAEFCSEVWHAIIPDRNADLYEDLDWDHDAPPIVVSEGSSSVVMMDGDTEKLDAFEIERRILELDDVKQASDNKRVATAINSALDVSDPEPVVHPVAEAQIVKPAAKASKKKPTKKKESDAVPTPVKAEKNLVATPGEPDRVEPKIVESKHKKKGDQQLDFLPLEKGDYKLPPIDLLHSEDVKDDDLNKDEMLELSARLTQTLGHYGIKGEVVAIRPGPVVTMYEFSPAPGTRLSKIVNLQDDLAMSLEALKVRIVAPIPGKAAVGIEVPNKSKETVFLKEIIATKTFQDPKLSLPMCLGKDIEGGPAVVDLAKMPHLLVAGTTGSGKSVSVNSMITSLLYSCTPDQVRMIMVDPKMLELSIYDGVPHLLLPVVTDPKKANLALRWGVEEMERRYDLLANAGVRDVKSYNKKIEKQLAEGPKKSAVDAWANESDNWDDSEKAEEPPTTLPYIVIIIDEFADLMMCAAKEVETSVARIAQKARAAGIHLILATQRPSVDVITGLIKANFPSRAAFRVTSKVDSRTILDQSGAEALLGAGDMLFSDRGMSPSRYHGCYVGEEEIHEVVEFLKTQGEPVYNLDIIKPRADSGSGKGKDDDVDEMYDRAVQIVTDSGKASISMVQRKLRVGYNRAARMVEQMEEEGIVGAPNHKNQREVLVSAAVA